VAEDAERALPGTVYIAPDDVHLGLTVAGRLQLSSAPPIQGFRPSANALFDSIARACGASCVAVILTGMGNDGVEGLRGVYAAGGRVIAQDEASSVVFGMPSAAITAGVTTLVLPLEVVAASLRGLLALRPTSKETVA
jgi:two-component system chemotaxis response regulator CheB